MSVAHYPTQDISHMPLVGKPLADHTDEDENSNLLVKFGKQLKSLDGIDEVAQALGQILPGLAGPLATAATLTLATPFVWLGLLGMKEEYEEACKEYNEILRSRKEADAKLLAMADNGDKWRKFLSRKLHLGIDDNSAAPHGALGALALDAQGLDQFAHQVVECEVLRNKEFVAALSRKYGWTGVVGMGGMFVGMLPATASAGIQIFNKAGITSQAALGASSILTTVSSSAFLVGQIAMSVYAANKVREGQAKEKVLCSNKKQFIKHAVPQIKPTTANAVLEDTQSELELNRKCNIQYGYGTVLGQMFMSAGTVVSLSGLGTLVGILLVAIGAPITVFAAIWRIFFSHKEENFSGAESDYAKKRIEKTQLLPMLLQEKPGKNVMQNLETEFEFCSKQLASMKLYSLMRHLVNDKKYSNYTSEQKFARLEKIVNKDRLSTTLRGDVLNTVREIFVSQRESIRNFMGLETLQANKVLLANVVNCAEAEEGTVPAFNINCDQSTNKDALQEMLKLTGMEGKEIYKRVVSGNIQESDYIRLNEWLVTSLKSSTKNIRHDLAHKFMDASHVMELRRAIAVENALQVGKIAIPDSQIRINSSNVAVPKPIINRDPTQTLLQRVVSSKGGRQGGLERAMVR